MAQGILLPKTKILDALEQWGYNLERELQS
jgi:hypothetical protein